MSSGHSQPSPPALAFIVFIVLIVACQRTRTEGFVTMEDGTRLHYVSVGRGAETVVVPMAVYLEEALAPIAPGRRVVFYDPRGRGRSDPADTAAVSLDRQVRDLDALRDSLRIDRMALIGWSGLGMEMAVYAMRHPDRVTRLVQVGAVPPRASLWAEAGGDARPARTDTIAVQELLRRFDAGDYAGDPAGFCREYNRLTTFANFADSARVALVPDVCEHPNEWPVTLWPYFGALLGSLGEYDWTDSIARLRIPRLVIHGRQDGVPLAGARAWAAYPEARLLVLSPAGHFPFLEQPEPFFRAVNRFLDGDWPEGAEVVPRR